MTARAPVSAAVPPLAVSKDAAAVAAPKEVPDIIMDPNTKRRYERGKFLGKGGFAKCYELKDLSTGEQLAGKIVPKSMLTKTHQKEKMSQVRSFVLHYITILCKVILTFFRRYDYTSQSPTSTLSNSSPTSKTVILCKHFFSQL
jgi:hypothetical protein